MLNPRNRHCLKHFKKIKAMYIPPTLYHLLGAPSPISHSTYQPCLIIELSSPQHHMNNLTLIHQVTQVTIKQPTCLPQMMQILLFPNQATMMLLMTIQVLHATFHLGIPLIYPIIDNYLLSTNVFLLIYLLFLIVPFPATQHGGGDEIYIIILMYVYVVDPS